MMIGVPLSMKDTDQPIPENLQSQAYANPQDPRSAYALELVQKGVTVREVLAHGVINYHPVIVGTPEKVADFVYCRSLRRFRNPTGCQL